MNEELVKSYNEVFEMAKWLKGNFYPESKQQQLIDFMLVNPVIPNVKDAHYITDRCKKMLGTDVRGLRKLLDEIKLLFRYFCSGEKAPKIEYDHRPNGGLLIPEINTQFYWDESDPSKILQFQGAIYLQIGDLVDFLMFPDYVPVGDYYIKDKVTQFDEGGMILGYRIAVWDFVPIED